jgi:hypothetical protein
MSAKGRWWNPRENRVAFGLVFGLAFVVVGITVLRLFD